SIILTTKYRLLSLAAIVDVFETANRFLREAGKAELFEITFVGITPNKALPEAISHIPFSTFTVDRQYDLIFVPAFGPIDIANTLAENDCFFPWLQQQYEHGATLASICTGVFLLAASGLLNGKKATTHVDAAGKL